MVKSFVLCCEVLLCETENVLFPFFLSMCMSHSCLDPWQWVRLEAGPGSHTGPHHSRQFCLMCMQGKYQERERFCYTPTSGTHLLHLYHKAFLLSTILCPHKLLPSELSHLNANFQTITIQFHNRLGHSYTFTNLFITFTFSNISLLPNYTTYYFLY